MLPPKNLPTDTAISVAMPTLAAMMPKPRFSMRGAVRTVILVPTVNRYMPRMVG